jgi:pimeloyl-ACP methyl ester carboxylesterase
MRRELADRAERERSIEPIVEAFLPRLFAPETLAQRPAVVEQAYAVARRNGWAGAAAALRGLALRPPSDDIAEDLAVPMVLLAGRRDAGLTLEEARSDAQRFAHGHLVVCERSGHLPMLEEPDFVTAALEAWLREPA